MTQVEDARIFGTPVEMLQDPREVLSAVRANGIVLVRNSRERAKGLAEIFAGHADLVEHALLPEQEDGVTQLKRSADKVGSFIYGGAWHQNLAFLERPPDVTVLRAETIEDSRNFTAFVDLAEVRPWLSEGMGELLRRSDALHSSMAADSPAVVLPGQVRVEAINREQSARHPAMIKDGTIEWPFALSNYVVALGAFTRDETTSLLGPLWRLATYDEFVIRHYWNPGDLLMWDNRRFLHRATVSHFAGQRVMSRVDLDCNWGLEPAIS